MPCVIARLAGRKQHHARFGEGATILAAYRGLRRPRRTPPNCHRSCQDCHPPAPKRGFIHPRQTSSVPSTRCQTQCAVCSCAASDDLLLRATTRPGIARRFGRRARLCFCQPSPAVAIASCLPLRTTHPRDLAGRRLVSVVEERGAVEHIVVLVAISVRRAGRLPRVPARSKTLFCSTSRIACLTRHQGSRSWGAGPQPPAWFGPAAAVCRAGYLVLDDGPAVSAVPSCTTCPSVGRSSALAQGAVGHGVVHAQFYSSERAALLMARRPANQEGQQLKQALTTAPPHRSLAAGIKREELTIVRFARPSRSA